MYSSSHTVTLVFWFPDVTLLIMILCIKAQTTSSFWVNYSLNSTICTVSLFPPSLVEI